MQNREIWKLTVHYFPQAAEAGVKPVEASFGALLSDEKEAHPEFYHPHTFFFDKPPSRDEFLAAMQTLAWTTVWNESLFATLVLNAWPMVDWMHKASSSDLHDHQGRIVGRMEIRRESVFLNEGINRSFVVTGDKVDQALKGMPKESRERAREFIRKNGNLIRERAFNADGKRPFPATDHPDDLIVRVIRYMLFAHGLRKTKPAGSGNHSLNLGDLT